MELVREIHGSRPETQVLLMTAFGSIDIAVEAVKAGAYHFVSKPGPCTYTLRINPPSSPGRPSKEQKGLF
jgi:ActR/RegA family two-component response regulator